MALSTPEVPMFGPFRSLHHWWRQHSAPTPIEGTPERLRLDRAKQALIATGYFTEAEVGDDVAPRIIELQAAYEASLREILLQVTGR